jgi:transcriptional regulator GlxA family with amidase domain
MPSSGATREGELNFSLFPEPVNLPAREPDLRIGFILAPRFSLLPLASFLDALRHAADEADFSRQIYCTWRILGAQVPECVASSCGLKVNVEAAFADPCDFDYLVVAGGQLPHSLEIGDETLGYLRAARSAGTGLIGICTGSFLLAKAGVLDGLHCAVHVEHERQMCGLFPKVIPVSDQMLVSDHGILTCPGGSSALDLAFSIIRLHCGRARAVKALTSLMVGRGRMAELAPDHDYAHLASCGHRTVEQVLEFMNKHLSSPCTISALAARFGVSESGLHAAFLRHAGTGPLEVWRNIRLSYGRSLLLNTNRTITQIAFECGFSDAAHFHKWFRKKFGQTPSSFRRTARSGTPRYPAKTVPSSPR